MVFIDIGKNTDGKPKDYSFRDKKNHPEIREGSPQARALNESGVGKIGNFQPISRRISETVQLARQE